MNFAESYPVSSNFWRETDDLSLLQAALLSFNIDPFALDEWMENVGEPITPANLPDGFTWRIEALRSSIRAGTLPTLTLEYDSRGRIHESKTRITAKDYLTWCEAKALPHNIPNLPESYRTAKWPWGNRETKLLRELAAAADKFWKNYDPSDPTTAPTNEQVVSWLNERGVAKRNAELIATMLRDDGLRPGPRK